MGAGWEWWAERGVPRRGRPVAGPGTGRATWGLRGLPWRLPPPRQPVPCSVLVGLWKWTAEQRALISSRQQDVGKNTPWKTRLRPGTKIAIVPPPGSRYQQREFVQVERPILFTVRTLARGRESFTNRAGREGPSGHSWNAAGSEPGCPTACGREAGHGMAAALALLREFRGKGSLKGAHLASCLYCLLDLETSHSPSKQNAA